MTNFGLTATSLFEIWTPAWSSTSTCGFHRGVVSYLESFCSLDWFCVFLLWASSFFFFLFFFLTNDVSLLLPLVKRNHIWVLSSAKFKQYIQITWKTILKMKGCYENSSREIHPGTRFGYLPDLSPFIWKYVFLTNSEAKIWFFGKF